MKTRIHRLEALIDRIDARGSKLVAKAISDRTFDGYLIARYGVAILSGRARKLAKAIDAIPVKRRIA
ncbi:MAG: hypothetical protein P4L67_04725 [Candidatus Pacebacteria bacterium]|nr:hypothetical protein [Candidatus Paceibacterota bacterium]